MTERAKQLRVTLVSDNGMVKIFRVEGGDSPHYVTLYPGGGKEVDSGGANVLANCKHLVAVRKSLEVKDEQARNIQEVVFSEAGEEDYETGFSVGVSAVG